MRETTQFVDEFFNVHERGVELGRGGQGVVFRTLDPDVAVKLVLDSGGQPVTQARYVDTIRRVRALPLPARLHLAAPQAALQDVAGYAMRLLSEMEPFSRFWPAPSSGSQGPQEIPSWLEQAPEELAHQLVSYRNTGGLKRRLAALYRVSAVLARLHGAGFVYGDVSPANCFISSRLASREVWLIDGDNVRFETQDSAHGVYTPRFGAPELVQGLGGASSRTDCYAFAVMSFWMLTLLHPFIGAFVEEGGEGDWADSGDDGDADDQAYAGKLPWILDADDDRNRKDNGLIGLVLNDELFGLFQETFGAGRTAPWRRPSMASWCAALARAHDTVTACSGCGMGYFAQVNEREETCPYCGTPRHRLLHIRSYYWSGEGLTIDRPDWRAALSFEPGGNSVWLPHRLLRPFSISDGDRDAVEVVEHGADLLLRCDDSGFGGKLAFTVGGDPSAPFRSFEGMAAAPISAVRDGLWVRVDGPVPRVPHLQTIERRQG